MKLILVMGPPRSGTSVTARILHEKLGVCMGHNLVPGNAGNPKGFYEDFGMVAAVKTKNPLTFISALFMTHTVVGDFGFYHHCGDVFGVKTPELAFMETVGMNPDLIIRTVRPALYIAQSLVRWHRPTPTLDEALKIVENYEKHIDVWCEKFESWPVTMFPKRDEEDLEYELRSCLQGVTARIRGS